MKIQVSTLRWAVSAALVMVTCLVQSTGVANAAATYLDANRDNVVRAADDSTDWWTTSSYTGDDRWRERPGDWGLSDSDTTLPAWGSTVSGGEIYQSIDSGQSGKDAAAPKITIDDVLVGDHLYVIFWSDEAGSPWSIRAGLDPDPNNWTTFSPYQGTRYERAYDSAGRVLWVGDLGVAPGAGSHTIYIDDLPTDDSNYRTWFDGVAAGIIPEPASVVLALGGLGILVLRRRD